MTHAPGPRVSLNEVAYRRLREDIIACRLAPGQRLTEKQLAADFGFSIAPLRDALTRLDHEGLIRTLPRKGYQVTPLTPKSIDDLFILWQIVGPELIRLGIRHATAEQIAAAEANFAELDRLAGEGGVGSVVRDIEVVNGTFGILAEATGNAYLVNLYQRLMGDMGRIRVLLLTSDQVSTPPAPAEHWVRRILAEDDPDEAAALASRYIEDVHRRVLTAVARWPSVMSSEVVVTASS
ncbi:GntR family transcriptional regulator [Amycolatopsis sp. H20-H5]|uniref:GntR family transcriptional regulator n=1 Tax=Amycolatopsis sp. H20-H5 TaxID=3046309 RepID=UPI002DB8E26E|nr:GntR family transcriptional regulator [Amycolatopsis sp. H20-H5]MEC3978010.1 GntR family transcriptional regulator [Amycolatopsis sp. H20-H5]